MAEGRRDPFVHIEAPQLSLTFVGYANGAKAEPTLFHHNGQTIPRETYESMDIIDLHVLRALCADIIAGIDTAREEP